MVRADLVTERLKAIEAGAALELLQAADDREREHKTCCVGVRWAYKREDLVEIVQVDNLNWRQQAGIADKSNAKSA